MKDFSKTQTKKETIFKFKTYTDNETGQQVEVMQKEYKSQGRKDFYILYLQKLCDVFDIFGGKKYKILEYIITNMDYDHKLVMTSRELAIATGTSLRTITETLKLLEENKIIVRKSGCIMLNPLLFNNKRSANQEQYLVFKFEHFNDEPKPPKKQKNTKKSPDIPTYDPNQISLLDDQDEIFGDIFDD